jgi:hypothetical protein
VQGLRRAGAHSTQTPVSPNRTGKARRSWRKVTPDPTVVGSGRVAGYDAGVSRVDDLAKMTVLDERGTPVELATLWRDRTVVLAFLRHFG